MTAEDPIFKKPRIPKGVTIERIPNDMGLREDDAATEKLLNSEEHRRVVAEHDKHVEWEPDEPDTHE